MLSNELIESLNGKQRSIINSPSHHKVIKAGAGTGKTRMLIAMAISLAMAIIRTICRHDKPILLLAYSNKAVAEIKERLSQVTDINQKDIVVKTFHGWCYSIINSSPFFNRYKNFTIIKEDECIKLFTPIINKMPKHSKVTAKKLIKIIALAKNTNRKISLVLKDEYPELLDFEDHIIKLIKTYKAEMKKNQVISFEDIFRIVGRKINNNVDALNWVVDKYSAILIDEAQDTNAAQWNIIEPIAKRLPITIVGDLAQAIYGFRGAESDSLNKALDILPNAEVFKLKKNYRSTPQNIAFTNNIFSVTGYNPKLLSMSPDGVKPKIKSFLNEEHEAEFVVDSIVDLHMDGHLLNDILVIARTNEDARYIAGKLKRQWLPVTLATNDDVLTTKCFLYIIAALTVASGQHKKFLMNRYFQLFKGVGIITAQYISECVIRGGYNRVINHMPNKDSISCAVDILRNVGGYKYAQEAIINLTRLMDSCLFDEYANKWDDNKIAILEWASTIDPKMTVDNFIEGMMLDGAVTQKTSSNAISVVTAHGSKGLQAKTCFLLNVSPEVYPLMFPKLVTNIEEERRVFYTAATRAEKNLVITSRLFTKKKHHFKTEVNRSDCFLNDIKTSLYDS
jgi:DNA helicase-2/ATP-dependent DNA helicase PcrA